MDSATTTFTLRDDGIVTAVVTNPEVRRDSATVAASLDVLADLIGGQPRPALWDPRPLVRLDFTGWVTIIHRVEQLATALAIMTDDATDGVLGSYPEVIGSLIIPVRTFRHEDAAFAWLGEFAA